MATSPVKELAKYFVVKTLVEATDLTLSLLENAGAMNPEERDRELLKISEEYLKVKLGFSRQHNRKADEGSRHPDRNAQFEHINANVVAAQAAGQPVISVDTKKKEKELVGNFKNSGSDYRPKGDPCRVNVHDFEDRELGKVVP